MEFVKAIEVCQMALKHRPNKTQKQRIVALICSPLREDVAALTALAKKVKKNTVAVDIVNVGCKENIEKLQTFVETVNNADNSHMVHIDVGAMSVADIVISSPINQGASGVMGEVSHAGVGAVDPNTDPELAEAIRQSLEDNKSMLSRTNIPSQPPQSSQAPPSSQPPQPPQSQPQQHPADDIEGLNEDELLQRAVMLSLEGKQEGPSSGQPVPATAPAPAPAPAPAAVPAAVPAPSAGGVTPGAPSAGPGTETPSGPSTPAPKPTAAPPKDEKKVDGSGEAELLNDPSFVNELLKELPITDAERSNVIATLEGQDKSKSAPAAPQKEKTDDKKEDKKPEDTPKPKEDKK